MKKIYITLSVLFFASQASFGQLTLTKSANEPVIGDMNSVAEFDSTIVIPKSTGLYQNWNFTSFTSSSFTERITYTTVAASPSAAAFPGATMASTTGGSNWEMWKASSTMLEFNGMIETSTPKSTPFSNLATWMSWPTSYGTSFSDSFIGTETAPTYVNNWNGATSLLASGAGTVTLPGGNVHTNCLQVIRTVTLAITSGTNTPTNLSMKYYEYWSSSVKFPIITILYQTITSGTFVSKSVDIKANISALNVGIEKYSKAEDTFIIYPNPATNNVRVLLPNNEIASSIEIIDIYGKVVASETNTNTIDVSRLAKAIYSIRVKSKESNIAMKKSLLISE